MLNFKPQDTKENVLNSVKNYFINKGYSIVDEDEQKPWGSYYRFDDSQLDKFISEFFPTLDLTDDEKKQKMSPKILIVAPHMRLSDQSHTRRSEIWNVIVGPIKVFTAKIGEEERITTEYQKGNVIKLPEGERHRLIGIENWGVVTEIWKHTDINNPSDESDIVRYQDDFGR